MYLLSYLLGARPVAGCPSDRGRGGGGGQPELPGQHQHGHQVRGEWALSLYLLTHPCSGHIPMRTPVTAPPAGLQRADIIRQGSSLQTGGGRREKSSWPRGVIMKENSCRRRGEITRGKSHLRRADTIQDRSGTGRLYPLTAEYTRIPAETEAEAER